MVLQSQDFGNKGNKIYLTLITTYAIINVMNVKEFFLEFSEECEGDLTYIS